MRTVLALAALLALSACARHEPSPSPPSPGPAAGAPAPSAPPATAPTTESRSSQNETEQATASQESGDAEDHQARSDASLEKLAGATATPQLPGGKWQAGVNYEPVVPAQPTSVAAGKVEVMEVFWLACPHCYALEPHIRSWLKSKPAYIEFVRVPVIWQEVHRAHARLFYTLEALGRDDLVEKAFDTIHQDLEKGQPPLVGQTDDETYQLQQQFAAQNGVSAADFSKAYNSFSVGSNMQRAEEITQRYHVQGVPFLVVNGKYSTDVSQAGGEGALMELIKDLAASEHTH